MIVTLNKENTLCVIKNSTVIASTSMMCETTVYTAKKVRSFEPEKCDVLFVVINKNREIITTKLVITESDKDDYLKYVIAPNNDFSLQEGIYSCYVIIYNPETNTHTSSNAIRLTAATGTEADLYEAFTQNVLDEFFAEMHEVKDHINKQVDRICKMTELNIKINNEISARAGEI